MAESRGRAHFQNHHFPRRSTHSILPLESTASSAVGLILLAAGHSGGWPILGGGAQSLTNVLIRHLVELGGTIVTAHEITQMPQTDLVLADLTPHQLLRLQDLELAPRYVEKLKRFRYGPGAFKIDYALSCPYRGPLQSPHESDFPDSRPLDFSIHDGHLYPHR